MIKVVTGHKVKEGADIQPILLKLRSHAMQYPGYVSAENLLGEKDSSIGMGEVKDKSRALSTGRDNLGRSS